MTGPEQENASQRLLDQGQQAADDRQQEEQENSRTNTNTVDNQIPEGAGEEQDQTVSDANDHGERLGSSSGRDILPSPVLDLLYQHYGGVLGEGASDDPPIDQENRMQSVLSYTSRGLRVNANNAVLATRVDNNVNMEVPRSESERNRSRRRRQLINVLTHALDGLDEDFP